MTAKLLGVTKEERDRLTKQVTQHMLIRLRRHGRQSLNNLKDLYVKRYKIREKMKLLTPFQKQELAELEDYMEMVVDAINSSKKVLALFGELLNNILPQYEQLATVHDFCQIANINMRQAEKALQPDSKKTDFIGLVFVHRLEPDNDDIFFECLYELFSQEIDNSSELQKATMDIAEECFPEIRGMMCYPTTDKNGKQVMEKYYPPLKLMKNKSDKY